MALTRLGLNQSINLSTNTTGTLGVANGGTGLTSGTTDQILKFTGSTTLASAAQAAGGKLLQTQTALFTSQSAHNSETYTASNYTDQITPSATNSKIFVCFNLRSHIYQASGSTVRSQLAIYRQINGGGYSAYRNMHLEMVHGGSDGYGKPSASFNYIDSNHSTTNAIDYKVYIKTNANGWTFNSGSSNMSILLMEIAA